jgi:hypothetical protein
MVDGATPYGSRRPQPKHSLERSSNRAQRVGVPAGASRGAGVLLLAHFGPTAMPSLIPECSAKADSRPSTLNSGLAHVTDPYSAIFIEFIHELLPLTKTIDRLSA